MAEIGLEKKEIEALDFAFDLGQSEQGQKYLKKTSRTPRTSSMPAT